MLIFIHFIRSSARIFCPNHELIFLKFFPRFFSQRQPEISSVDKSEFCHLKIICGLSSNLRLDLLNCHITNLPFVLANINLKKLIFILRHLPRTGMDRVPSLGGGGGGGGGARNDSIRFSKFSPNRHGIEKILGSLRRPRNL